MIRSWQYFKQDVRKYYRVLEKTENVKFKRKIILFIYSFGLHCIAVYRFRQFVEEVKKINKILSIPFLLVHAFLDLYIKGVYHVHFQCDVGPGLFIGHIGTIYIGAKSIGSNLSITHNVTIGKGNSKGKIGYPTIGNNVWIGTGAIITGDITIGNNVTIGPGSVLNTDVADGFYVSGNPARPLIKDYSNSHLLGDIHANKENENGEAKSQ